MVVVVAELADWSLLTREVCGSNVVIFSDDCCKDAKKIQNITLRAYMDDHHIGPSDLKVMGLNPAS